MHTFLECALEVREKAIELKITAVFTSRGKKKS